MFGVGVGMEYAFKNNGMGEGFAGRQNAEGRLFEGASMDILWADKFDIKSFKTAVDNFKKGSSKNRYGLYNKFPVKPVKANEILISKFFPLVNW